MQDHAAAEEKDAIGGNLDIGRLAQTLERVRDNVIDRQTQDREGHAETQGEREGDEHEEDVGGGPVVALGREAEDEREEIGGQRKDPEKGNARDVETDRVGDAHQEDDRAAGQQDPERESDPVGRFRSVSRIRDGRYAADLGLPGDPRAGEHPDRRRGERPGPEGARRRKGQAGLQEEGVGEEGREGTDIRNGVERIGGSIRMRSCEPRLDQGAGRRQDHEGQRHVGREHRDDVPARIRHVVRLPDLAGQDGESDEGGSDEERMDPDLGLRRAEADQEMGIGIAEEERRLVEGQADRPDTRGAAEPGQDPLSHHGLDQEDQEGRGEDGQGEEGDGAMGGALSSRCRIRGHGRA